MRKGDDQVGLDVMNECIDSTMGRIHVCLMCCLQVTIRGLVGSYTDSLNGLPKISPTVEAFPQRLAKNSLNGLPKTSPDS
jgi:hypothetical protein